MATKQKTYEEELLAAEQQLADLQYQKSEQVLAAEQALADYAASKPGEYTGGYQQQIDALMEQILNRGGLEYSFDADPLYQQYKDQYTRSAGLALQDTMAQAAALTGGYGSSYAASAGSLAYQEQMAKLDGVLPTLYGLALDRWNSENDALMAQLDGLTGLEQNARDAYDQTVKDYYTGLEYYTSAAQDAYSNDYKAYETRREALEDLRDYYAGQQQQQFDNAQSEAEYQLAVQKYEESVRQWQAEQAAAQARWQAELAWEKEMFNRKMGQQTVISNGSAANSGNTGGTSSGGSTNKKPQNSQNAGQNTGKNEAANESKLPGAGRGDTSAGAPVLSAAAKQVQSQLNQQLSALSSRTGGLSASQQNAVITTMLTNYVASGTITRAEANRIGLQWGVAV